MTATCVRLESIALSWVYRRQPWIVLLDTIVQLELKLRSQRMEQQEIYVQKANTVPKERQFRAIVRMEPIPTYWASRRATRVLQASIAMSPQLNLLHVHILVTVLQELVQINQNVHQEHSTTSTS